VMSVLPDEGERVALRTVRSGSGSLTKGATGGAAGNERHARCAAWSLASDRCLPRCRRSARLLSRPCAMSPTKDATPHYDTKLNRMEIKAEDQIFTISG
jgi:hypothetical protein